MYKVYNQYGKLVSGADHDNTLPRDATRTVVEEKYARGCGWNCAADMRLYYPLDTFVYVYVEAEE